MNIGILCPTRQRVDWTKRMIESCLDTASEPDHIKIVLRLDMDDFESHPGYTKLVRVGVDKILKGPGKCLSLLWNDAYDLLGESTQINQHSGDDLIFRTKDWDGAVRDTARQFPNKVGMVYLDDGLQHEGLATHGFYSRKWSETIGYFCPPYFSHDYNDTWLTFLGKNIQAQGFPKACVYRGDKLIEHMHCTAPDGKGGTKAPVDDVYKLAHMRKARQDCDPIYHEKLPARKKDVEKLLAAIKGKTK